MCQLKYKDLLDSCNIYVIKDQCVSHDSIYIKGNMHKYFNISIFCTILHHKIFRGLSIDDICGLN